MSARRGRKSNGAVASAVEEQIASMGLSAEVMKKIEDEIKQLSEMPEISKEKCFCCGRSPETMDSFVMIRGLIRRGLPNAKKGGLM